jgi:hypothetical protein
MNMDDEESIKKLKESIKKLLKFTDGIPKQNINLPSLHLDSEVIQLLKETGVFTERKIKKIEQVAFGHLVANIDLHTDSDFLYGPLSSKACLIILSDETMKTNRTDDPMHSYFYHDKELEVIRKGSVVWFNSLKPHAVFPKYSLKYVAIFFRK